MDMESDQSANSRVWCVLGMHRSGTSMTAGLLGAAGVHMGKRLLPEHPDDNPYGYCEDLDLIEFHEACLKRRGLFYMRPTGPIIFDETERAQALRLIEDRGGQIPWGWKDPRTCLFVRSWHQLLGERATYVIVYRDPLDVCASLMRRSEEHSVRGLTSPFLRAWTIYNRCISDFLEACSPKAVVLESTAIIQKPRETLSLFNSLGLPLTLEQITVSVHPEAMSTMGLSEALWPLLLRLEPRLAVEMERLKSRSALSAHASHRRLSPTSQVIVHAALESSSGEMTARALYDLLKSILQIEEPIISERADRAGELMFKALSDRSQHAAAAAPAAAPQNQPQVLVADRGSNGKHPPSRMDGYLVDEHEARLAAEARSDSLAQRLDRLSKSFHEVETDLRGARQAVHQAELNISHLTHARNYYRRRWPPYWIKAGALVMYRRFASRSHKASQQFGKDARVAVLWTGLPAVSLQESLQRQTHPVECLIVPGSSAVRAAKNLKAIQVKNWWGPDLPALLRNVDYALMMHPEYYGAGPLWSSTFIEMLVATMACERSITAILVRGEKGEPKMGPMNYLHAIDEATLENWPYQDLVLFARSRPLIDAFSRANPGESRHLRATADYLSRKSPAAVLPQTFPLEAPISAKWSHSIGEKLPAEPKAPIKALYVTQWVECGGADKGAVDLLTRSDHNVVEFSLLTTLAALQSWEWRVREHVREIVHVGNTLPIPTGPKHSEFIVEYIRRRGIGLVHIMHSFAAYDALPALKKALPNVKVIDQCHILEPPDIMNGGHPAYSSRNYKQYFDHRTVTSQWLKRYLMDEHRIPENQISVIYTGVDHEREFNPDQIQPGEFRRQMGIPAHLPIILFVGRLHAQKRPKLFVRIAGEFQKRYPALDAAFVMVGSGNEKESLDALRSKLPSPQRFYLAGELKQSASAYRDAAMLLMTSGHEGLAYVSFEAMAMGLPQIFTDVNAQSELITPETGILIPVEEEATVEQGVAAVARLLGDAPRRSAMGAAGRQRVSQHFRIAHMVSQYEQLYKRLLS
jgi:glycosyltransferase involved in cell wall biosynthesis